MILTTINNTSFVNMFQKEIFSKGSTHLPVRPYLTFQKAKQGTISDSFVVLSGIAMKLFKYAIGTLSRIIFFLIMIIMWNLLTLASAIHLEIKREKEIRVILKRRTSCKIMQGLTAIFLLKQPQGRSILANLQIYGRVQLPCTKSRLESCHLTPRIE